MKTLPRSSLNLVLFLFLSVIANAGDKYGRDAKPLSRNFTLLQNKKNTDFWSLIPFYIGQYNGAACSIASVTMIVNSAQALHQKQTSDQKNYSQEALIDLSKNEIWTKHVKAGKRGMTLDELNDATQAAFKATGHPSVTTKVTHVENTNSKTVDLFRKALLKNNESRKNYILINFHQTEVTGDPEGVGHIAVIGDYDAKKDQVLILDPDREYYEPYYTSVTTLIRAMGTKDSSINQFRGYLEVGI